MLTRWGGGLSGAVVLPSSLVLPLPANIPLSTGALIEPLSVGWHAVMQSPLKPTSTVLILYGGLIDIAVILALRTRSCGDIFVSEPSAARQNFMKHFGASHLLSPFKETDIVGKIREITGGDGVDMVFDCTGVVSGLDAGFQAIKAKGTVLNLAIFEKTILFDQNVMIYRESS